MTKLNLDDLLVVPQLRLPEYNITGFEGFCAYYHYGMQNTDDRGWGCGYRTLQTILSWFRESHMSDLTIPTLKDIQNVLCRIGDKPLAFDGSREWIGAVECGHVVATLTNSAFRILNIPGGRFTRDNLNVLSDHFNMTCCPVMMGGKTDNSSKGILAIAECATSAKLLICDPHFYTTTDEPTIDYLCSHGWIKWFDVEELTEESFYNVCLPIYTKKGTI